MNELTIIVPGYDAPVSADRVVLDDMGIEPSIYEPLIQSAEAERAIAAIQSEATTARAKVSGGADAVTLATYAKKKAVAEKILAGSELTQSDQLIYQQFASAKGYTAQQWAQRVKTRDAAFSAALDTIDAAEAQAIAAVRSGDAAAFESMKTGLASAEAAMTRRLTLMIAVGDMVTLGQGLTADGMPHVDAIQAATGYTISAAERNQIFEQVTT